MKFGIRWYNPVTGTWTQQDTLDAPLDPSNGNRYVFVGGDPINGLDPSGNDSLCDAVPGRDECGPGGYGNAAIPQQFIDAAGTFCTAVDVYAGIAVFVPFADAPGAVITAGCGVVALGTAAGTS